MRTLQRVFVAAAIAWAAALPLAAWAASRPHASSIPYALALGVYAVGSFVCHQLPERSFHLWATQLPVCARCTGIYVGGALAAIASTASASVRASVARGVQPGDRPGDRRSRERLGLLLALAPTLATLVYEWTTGQTPAHWIRAAAGFPLGAAVAWLVVSGARSARGHAGPARK